jgi:beta-glucosidase
MTHDTEQDIAGILASLDLDEQASLTSGADMWHGHAVARVGLPALKVTDGPVGARGARFVGTSSACAPCPTALGATWNPDLVAEVGRVLGAETRAKRAHVLLAPTVNLHRTPLAGRNFECFSEDPLLTARLAVAYVCGVQSAGVGACIKHLVANDSEFERHTISSEVGERTLRELYLLPFEAAVVDGDVAAVMAAYNRLNGTYCAEHPWLLRDVLKGEWGFRGAVISDWWGTKSPASAEAGLDLEMPGPPIHLGPTTARRVREGELDPAVLEEQARRVLRLAARTGALEPDEGPESSEETPGAREVLRRAAAEGIVLLRNEAVDGAPVLPLDPTAIRSLAVIGPNAAATALLGGGSAAVNPHHTGSILDGIVERYGPGVRVLHEPGVDATRSAHPIPERQCRPGRAGDGPTGLTVEYFANRELAGEPYLVERVPSSRLVWIDDDAVPSSGFSVRVSGTFIAPASGEHTFGLVTAGTGVLRLGGEVLLDNTTDRRPGTAFFGMGSEEIRARVPLGAGEERELVCEFVSFEGLGFGAVQIGYVPPMPPDGIERAAAAAAEADAAVVVVGLNADWETEGEDRADLSLPGGQDDLIRAVLAANPRTAVLVNAGAPVDLDVAATAPALAYVWYPGQEASGAVADVLAGDVAPSGRLPTTLGRRFEDWPSSLNYPGEAGRVLYGEELFMGYRGFDARRIEPRFCFGHGLGYTTFEWGTPTVSTPTIDRSELGGDTTGGGDCGLVVTVPVTNTGDRTGAEVVQCYLRALQPGLRRPPQELRAFAKVELEPGASAEVTLPLGFRAFAVWDPAAGCWTVEPGPYQLRIARSSRNLHATVEVEVTARD